ncbi:MAG TPA: hypothetical protein PLQ45_04325 [Anaerohalosphaeraceae bacterium]|nr:hypothetical protein [Anaerohalosphaeraceae bacterium]
MEDKETGPPTFIALPIDTVEASRKLPTLEIVAYTGGFMNVPGWGPLCIDLNGLEAGQVAILADHDANRSGVVGHGIATVEANKLVVRGQISADGEAAREVVSAAKNGFPWQASVGLQVIQSKRLRAGDALELNGRRLTVPDAGAVLVVKGKLREVSITALALAKMYNWMKTLTDKGWDSEGFMKAVQENFSESMSGIDIDLNERKKAAEERRQAARDRQNQELEKTLTGLAERRIQSQENIQTARDEELSKLGDELAAARKEWSQAIDKAIQNNQGEETLSRQEQMRRKMEEAAAASSMAFSEAMKTATATGTFSGAAAEGLGVGGLQQKIADATAATAKNTQKIADSVGEGSVFM